MATGWCSHLLRYSATKKIRSILAST